MKARRASGRRPSVRAASAGRAKSNPIPPVVAQELGELAALAGRLRRGEIERTEFRGHGVHFGVYTQRQPDGYFVRIRVPLGVLTAAQLAALADAAERWADGECHLTTRQGVEIHNLSLDGMLDALTALAGAGLSSHESGGNTVRGILVCAHASRAEGAPFDATEHAALLHRHLLRHPDFQALPRKIKIGFSCCAQDCTHTVLQDLGFQARTGDSGAPGFRVLAGGGAGALPRLGVEMLDFLPAKDLVIFTEAFLRMFNRLGDRQNRRRSRVKFLLEALGLQRLREEVMAEWAALKAAGGKWPSVRRGAPRPARVGPRHSVRVALEGGNATSDQLRRLAALAEKYAVPLRITPGQDLLVCEVRPRQLDAVRAALREARLLSNGAGFRLTVCPGSAACSNAFTHTRALADAMSARLAAIGDSEAGESLRIRVSGCTNGCALHAIAGIGLEGLAQRRDGALIPAYRLWLGGREHQQHPRLATDAGILPARRVADCVGDVVRLYRRERRAGESLSEVLDRIGLEPFTACVQQHRNGGDPAELASDLGQSSAYRPPGDAASGSC